MLPQFKNKLICVLSGDYGGDSWPAASTKFGFYLTNVSKPNSPANFTLLAVLNCDDRRAALLAHLEPVLRQIRNLKCVKVFLNGREECLQIRW